MPRSPSPPSGMALGAAPRRGLPLLPVALLLLLLLPSAPAPLASASPAPPGAPAPAPQDSCTSCGFRRRVAPAQEQQQQQQQQQQPQQGQYQQQGPPGGEGDPGAEPEPDGGFLEAVKRHILSRLQLRERPNITHAVPKAALVTALRKLHAGKVREDGRVEIPSLDGQASPGAPAPAPSSEIISFAETDDLASSRMRLYFFISNEGNQNLFVVQASLWLYLKLLPYVLEKGSRRKVRVKVYFQDSDTSNKWNVVEKKVDLKRSGWHTFPMTEAIQALFEKGERRLNLDIQCEACEEYSVLPIYVDPGDESHRPFLVVQARLADNKHRIRKRGLECDGRTNLCCRQQFYIDFKLIGWNDWIIAPLGYFGNYCEGSCPSYLAGVPGSASSFHTAVVNQYRMRGLNPGTVNSCCIPTKLSTMSMLYFDDEYNIVKRDVPNMIVEECGCA